MWTYSDNQPVLKEFISSHHFWINWCQQPMCGGILSLNDIDMLELISAGDMYYCNEEHDDPMLAFPARCTRCDSTTIVPLIIFDDKSKQRSGMCELTFRVGYLRMRMMDELDGILKEIIDEYGYYKG